MLIRIIQYRMARLSDERSVLSSSACSSRNGAEVPATASEPAAQKTKAQANGPTNWPVFRGNAQATGVAESSLPDQPALLWKFPVDKGEFDATPVIVDDTVYIGDMDGTFYAIDLNTGEKRWKFDNPDDKTGFNTAAAVRDGLVYIGDIERQFLLS